MFAGSDGGKGRGPPAGEMPARARSDYDPLAVAQRRGCSNQPSDPRRRTDLSDKLARVQVGGASIAYETAGGQGPPLLLIAGLGTGRWIWKPQVEGLRRDFRVITFDNRGIGDSTAPPGRLTISRMAGDVVAVLDALGVEKAHVAGMSMGGFIAQTVAVRWPERVDRLVLMCTAGRVLGQVWPHPRFLATALAGLCSGGITEARLRVFFSDGYLKRNRVQVQSLAGLAAGSLPDRRVFWRQLRAVLPFSAGGALRNLPHPTLVIHGTEDRVIPAANGRKLACSISGARFVLLEGAGHGINIERADEVNAEIKDFLHR